MRRHAACTVPASTPALAAIAAQLQRPTDGGDWHKADTGGARTHQDEAEMVCYDRDGDGSYDDCVLGKHRVGRLREWDGKINTQRALSGDARVSQGRVYPMGKSVHQPSPPRLL